MPRSTTGAFLWAVAHVRTLQAWRIPVISTYEPQPAQHHGGECRSVQTIEILHLLPQRLALGGGEGALRRGAAENGNANGGVLDNESRANASSARGEEQT